MKTVSEEQPPYPMYRFKNDMKRHLGGPRLAVSKDDGVLAHIHSLGPDFVSELDLEAVAIGADLVQRD